MATRVPGDMVKLSLGSVVPADVQLDSGAVLFDQSTLTGEPVKVDAAAGSNALAGALLRWGEAAGRGDGAKRRGEAGGPRDGNRHPDDVRPQGGAGPQRQSGEFATEDDACGRSKPWPAPRRVTIVQAVAGFDEAHVLALAALASSDGGQDPADAAIHVAAAARKSSIVQYRFR